MTVFFIGDTHFHHEKILLFEPIRAYSCVEEMNETLVQNWNSVVGPRDKVYHLGDVSFAGKSTDPLAIVGRLNGRKRLVLGNHDRFPIQAYAKYFDKIVGATKVRDFWLTHIPIHPMSFNEGRGKFNVHGHIHSKRIDDPRYINVSVECINFRPVAADSVV